MAPRLTRSLAALRAGFDALSPGRDRASDGWIGDTAHQQSTSGHNPDDTPGSRSEYADGDQVPEVRALDVDKDLRHPTVTMSEAVARILATPEDRRRLRYVIYDGAIRSASDGWSSRPYNGPNPHTKHAHFSGHPDYDDDGRPWSVATMGDDMATPAEIAAAVWNAGQRDPVDGKVYTYGNYVRFIEYNVREQLGPVMSKLDALAAVMNGTASADWLRTRFAEIDQRFAEQRKSIEAVPDQVVGELGGMDVDQLVDALAAAGVDLGELAEAAIERASSGPAASNVGERASGDAGPAGDVDQGDALDVSGPDQVPGSVTVEGAPK